MARGLLLRESTRGMRVSGSHIVASGALAHGDAFTITGSGFGVKTSNLTNEWDDCNTGVWDDHWDGGWPFSSTSDYNLGYRTPATDGDSVGTPHPFATRFLSGAHCSGGNGAGSTSAYNVAFWKNYSRIVNGWSVWSFYHRLNPFWAFNLGNTHGDPDDDNHKMYGYSAQGTIYEFPNNVYWGATPNTMGSASGTAGLGTADDSSGGFSNMTGSSYDDNSFWDKDALFGQWSKMEILVKFSATAGVAKNLCLFNYNWAGQYNKGGGAGYNDGYTASALRSEGLGGYSRDYAGDAVFAQSAHNRRYWCDIHWDHGLNPGRFYLANHATFTSATIFEYQPHVNSTWTDTSVPLRCNKGALPSGTAHKHYRNEETGAHQYLGTVTLQ